MVNLDHLLFLILLLGCMGIGASIGSFLNVCIYRIPVGLSVTRPSRSFCPSCRHQIEARDNVPVLSWLWLRGRCRHCRAAISPWYFLIELLAGLGAGIAYIKGGLEAVGGFLLFFSLAAIALRSAHEGVRPSPFLLAGILCAGSFVLIQRHVSVADMPFSTFACVAIGLFLARHWPGVRDMDWKWQLVLILAALVSGWQAALLLAVVVFILPKFSLRESRFASLSDALLLTGVCLGALAA